jgi:hypothetical protein
MQTVDDLNLDFENENIILEEDLIKREPIDSIDLFFIYIDSDMSIEKIVCENEEVLNLENGRGIHKDRLLQFIQQKRFINNKKYKLMNFFHFQVPLEQEQLQSFIKNTMIEFPEFMKSPSYLKDLIVDDSMPIFHDLNSLFFFLKSTELRTLTKTAKSLNSGLNPRVTKKVRFVS